MKIKKICDLVCTEQSSFPRTKDMGGFFDEINTSIVKNVTTCTVPESPGQTSCTGVLSELCTQMKNEDIRAFLRLHQTSFAVDMLHALLFIEKVASWYLLEADRKFIVFLSSTTDFYFSVNSQYNGTEKDKILWKRILLCRYKPDYTYPMGTAVISY